MIRLGGELDHPVVDELLHGGQPVPGVGGGGQGVDVVHDPLLVLDDRAEDDDHGPPVSIENLTNGWRYRMVLPMVIASPSY